MGQVVDGIEIKKSKNPPISTGRINGRRPTVVLRSMKPGDFVELYPSDNLGSWRVAAYRLGLTVTCRKQEDGSYHLYVLDPAKLLPESDEE